MYTLSNLNVFVCYTLKLLLIQSVKKILRGLCHVSKMPCVGQISPGKDLFTRQSKTHNLEVAVSLRGRGAHRASIENPKLTNTNTTSSVLHLSNIPKWCSINEAATARQKQNIHRSDSTHRMPMSTSVRSGKDGDSVKITPVGKIFYSFHNGFASMA